MISEHAAVARPGVLRTRTAAPPWWGRLTARPSISGRERLEQAIHHSFLVQLALSMTFVALAALLYMAQAGQVDVQKLNINSLTTERMNLVAANASYSAEATRLQLPQRIDTIATTRFHMAAPPPGDVVWLNPVVPRVAPVRPVNADALSAQQASQPLAWMEHAVSLVRSSL